jgi:hypothetical protein
MKKYTAVLLSLAVTLIASAAGPSPWHYKGIYLDSKMTREQVMKELGATKFVNNPTDTVWDGCVNGKGKCPFTDYGMAAAEFIDFQRGPYCEDSSIEAAGGFSCTNPWMLSGSSDGHNISEVEVFGLKDGTVTALDIFFPSETFDEVFDLVRRQFAGAGVWRRNAECEGPMEIHWPVTAKAPGVKSITVDRICETLRTKQYQAAIENYDIVLAHVAGPTYRGILEIKRLDQEL